MAVAASRTQPPALLRQELAAARERGVDFETAWTIATARSLRGINAEERARWRGAYAWSERYWRVAFSGLAWDSCHGPIYPT